ncbi:hypothetical protein B5F53_10700 [Blautia sp. An249]|jgi:hypothetical protein|uniref:hypothetical protein n=1 Tax=Blautia sp. An249 TaxID=1965603 RepID=UPI000B369C85|nr:hypothetical protein [Blautia sp. An249]OUO78397.1 hypothetical protein B5F53_10700 [Blautia sp. An249]
MKVKEAKEKINHLKQLYDNAVKIQNCCLNNKISEGTVDDLEEKSGINTSLRIFATCVGTLAAGEMKRISNIIDNADVNID